MLDDMDGPISFSYYFVNKQTIRSFNNILNVKYLQEKVFIQNLLEDECSVSDLPELFVSILEDLRKNLRSHCTEDFRPYFPYIKCGEKMNKIDREYVFTGCIKALKDIVPSGFFGGNHNYKIYKKLVFTVIFSMNRQHIFLSKIIGKWDFSILPWQSVSSLISQKVLFKVLHWIMKYILSAIISLNFYVTTCKLDTDENKLYYFKKEHWQSFYDKIISNMIFTKTISKYNNSSRKAGKKNFNLQDRLMKKNLKKDIPKLYLKLKPNNSFRPIVCYKNGYLDKVHKRKISEKFMLLKMLIGKTQERVEKQYELLHTMWLEKSKPKLYFIKADLSNAFGSVNKLFLLKILYERYLEFQKSVQYGQSKKKYEQCFQEIIAELQKPLLIRIGSTFYEWKEGLVQGYKLSPALSELYYSYMDEINFKDFVGKAKSLNLFIRVVDDYLYITDSMKDALSFLEALSNYKNVNYEKTVVNFNHEFIKNNDCITFLGHCYDTTTLRVCRANNVYSGQLCYKISFSPAIVNPYKFLENRIGLSGIQISSHIFNLNYNDEICIWENIYITLSIAANKFCTILAILCNQLEIEKYFLVYKRKVTVKLCNCIIETIIKNKPRHVLFVYCINHLRFLSYKALLLCAKATPKCSALVPLIKSELAKSDCLFGKWREHGSVISSAGKICLQAVREICKRPDLKLIMKKFDSLPDGFECYKNHRLKCIEN